MEGERPFLDRCSRCFGKCQAMLDLPGHAYRNYEKYLSPLELLVADGTEKVMEVVGMKAVDIVEVMYSVVVFLSALVQHFESADLVGKNWALEGQTLELGYRLPNDCRLCSSEAKQVEADHTGIDWRGRERRDGFHVDREILPVVVS